MYNLEKINDTIKLYNRGLLIKNIIKQVEISYSSFRCWFCKYNEFYVNNTPMNEEEFKNINKQYVHKSNKRFKYTESIIQYVNNNNNGCSLENIKNNVTQDNLSYSSICRVLKENKITRKTINNKIVCKDIDKINKERQDYKSSINDDYYNFVSIDDK